jgi:hypothetical protein
LQPGGSTAFALLVLANRPLVALDGHAAVLADRHRTAPAPVGWALTDQLTTAGVDSPALLVAGESWSGGDEASLHAPKQQGLASQVLQVETGGCHQHKVCLHYQWWHVLHLATTRGGSSGHWLLVADQGSRS